MNKIVLTLMMITFSISEESACLPKVALEALGFTYVLDSPVENTANSVACSSFSNVCIQPDTLLTQITVFLETYQSSIQEQLGSLTKLEEGFNRNLHKIKKGLESEKGLKHLEEKLGEDLAIVKELVAAYCNETECNAIQTDILQTKEVCRVAIADTIAKALCLIGSDQANGIVSFSAEGSLESLDIGFESIAEVFTGCIDYFEPMCQIVNLMGIFEKMAKGKRKDRKKHMEQMIETCSNVSVISACVANEVACSQEIRSEIFMAFISVGEDSVPGYSAAELEEEEANAETSGDDASSNSRLLVAKPRILSESATSTCSFTVSDKGFDLSKVKTGIDATKYGTAGLITVSIFAFLTTFLIKSN